MKAEVSSYPEIKFREACEQETKYSKSRKYMLTRCHFWVLFHFWGGNEGSLQVGK